MSFCSKQRKFAINIKNFRELLLKTFFDPPTLLLRDLSYSPLKKIFFGQTMCKKCRLVEKICIN